MSGMKTSTIKKLLSERVEKWLKSITDTAVQETARQSAIVSGGAIASALAGDKINDYDIYFNSRAAAMTVAKYYVDLFNKTNGDKKAPGGASCSPAIKEMKRKNIKGVEEDRIVIYMKSAGVAGEDQSEYKYFEGEGEGATEEFFQSLDSPTDISVEKAQETAEEVTPSKDKTPYRPVFLSENAITLSDRIQLVIRFHGNPDQIHENYDYAHCMCYYIHHRYELVCPAEALEAILSKTLIYKGSLYPVSSIFRIRKFIERGWRITAGQMLKIVHQISNIDLNDTNVLREQLVGVDQAYMHQLIRALQNKEGNQKIDATYLAKLIDEIFE